jgi:hypothetical protein
MARRGRGIDFEHRFKTSRRAEDLVISALGSDHGLMTVRLGVSEVRGDDDLATADPRYKIPDLLVLSRPDLTPEHRLLLESADLVRQPLDAFLPGGDFRFAIESALAAVEVEFSPYRAAEAKGRHWIPPSPQRLRTRPRRTATPPTAPTIFVKHEDLGGLVCWEKEFRLPIVVIHLFDQEAFCIPLRAIADFDRAYEANPDGQVQLQLTTGIFRLMQVYERVDAQGARERKLVFRVSPAAAQKVGEVLDVRVTAQLGVSASKKYVAHVLFEGGRLQVTDEFLQFLRQLRT